MSYLRFHLLFNLPLLAGLLALNLATDLAWDSGDLQAMALVLAAVLLFTTPWDNLAARWGIWGFPPGKYLCKIGYLPVEEYAFFLLQSLNVMLAVRGLFRFMPAWQISPIVRVDFWTLLGLALSVIGWLIVGLGLLWVRRRWGRKLNYALHLVWFFPIIYGQWLLAPVLFGLHAGLLLLVTLAFSVYYTAADLVAVRGGTWFFDEKQITGWKLGGVLPWEEIAFFLLTSGLVAQSYLLLLPEELR